MASQPLHRPITFARRGMVVAPHYLAAEAGLELLKAGSNALDAAVAASAMLTEALRMESRFPPQNLQALRQRGHRIEVLNPWEAGMGYAQGITFDPSTGIMQGGADPRAESLAAAW